MISFTLRVLRNLKRPVLLYLLTLSFTLQALFTLLIFAFESELNPRLGTLFDSYYFTVTLMTGVGLGDIHPITVAGKTVAILMMLSGTALFVCFTAVLATLFMEVEIEHRGARPDQRS